MCSPELLPASGPVLARQAAGTSLHAVSYNKCRQQHARLLQCKNVILFVQGADHLIVIDSLGCTVRCGTHAAQHMRRFSIHLLPLLTVPAMLQSFILGMDTCLLPSSSGGWGGDHADPCSQSHFANQHNDSINKCTATLSTTSSPFTLVHAGWAPFQQWGGPFAGSHS